MTKRILLSLVLAAGAAGSVTAQSPAPAAPAAPASPAPTLQSQDSYPANILTGEAPRCVSDAIDRKPLESDRAFSGFIGPMSNPVLSKDPRSTTEARFLFINNTFPSDHALGGGSFQVYALQLRAALTDRLTLIADKDGIANISAKGLDHRVGLLNMNFGLRYLLVRDVENQFLLSTGFTYEPPMGYRNVFENHGDGVMSVFATAGKEFNCNWHLLHTTGYQFGLNGDQNSAFFYNSTHIDRRVLGFLYPLVEFNWFHYNHSGNRGLPPALGEGDGLLNLGTSGVAGNDLVTCAAGLKVKVNDYMETGAVWEVPLTSRKDLIQNRLTFEFILRY